MLINKYNSMLILNGGGGGDTVEGNAGYLWLMGGVVVMGGQGNLTG